MCRRFTTNRRRFADLMYNMRCFGEQEIIDRFRKDQRGDVVIDGTQTISQYLRELREQGALRYIEGKYLVPNNQQC